MAINVMYYKDQPSDAHRMFLCDTRSDISNLPTQTRTTATFKNGTPAGSTAFVTEDSSVWILGNAGEWVEV